MEENKINSPEIFQQKGKKNNRETVEINLGRPNPAFNLVSLKARFRFHQIKQNFSKFDYNSYLRRCKNMYSISSKMSSELDISDIYREEKKNIKDIFDIYQKIEKKMCSNKIRLTKPKQDDSNIKMLKEKSLSAVNLYKSKSNLSRFRITSNDFNSFGNNKRLSSQRMNKNSNNKNKQSKSTYSSNFKGDFSNDFINSKMNDANYRMNKTGKDYILIKKNSFFGDNKDFNKTFGPSLKNQRMISDKKTENIEKNSISNRNKIAEDYGLYNFQTKQMPLSGKSQGLTITNFGAIIYNNSIFRNKGISNFLYDNQSLPLIYNEKY